MSENRITSNPVCGSDGITYRNICGLQLAACGKGRNITVMKTEPCDGDYDDSIGKLGFAYLIDSKCFNINIFILNFCLTINYTIHFSDETSLCGVDGCPFGGVCMKDPPSVGGQYQCRCKECDRVLGKSEVVCGKSIS